MIELPMAPLAPSEAMSGDEQQTALGLRHCHQQMITLAQQIFEASAQIGAALSALQARGLIDEEELVAHRQAEEERLEALFQEKHVGVQIENRVPDKYALDPAALPAIDCASRYHLCRAACCSLRFPLSRQDLDEGVIRWDLGQPYSNRQGADGYCAHLDRATRRCSVYAHRPGICRTYDCRADTRIWLDFDNMIVNPDLFPVGGDGTPQFKARLVEVPASAVAIEPDAGMEEPC